MSKEEKVILKKVIDFHKGLLYPVDLFNRIGQHNSEKIIHKLITENYIEEVPTELRGRNYTFYRVTEKGFSVFYPIHRKLLYNFGRDLRTIAVSVITALITTIIIILIKN